MTSSNQAWPRLRAGLALLVALLCIGGGSHATAATARERSVAPDDELLSSAAWLNTLPDGEEKRRFILDCTGCHQFNSRIALVDGRLRTRDEWVEAVTRMLGYAGARTGFPVISSYRNPHLTAAWLSASLSRPTEGPVPVSSKHVTEFFMPEPTDLPHDVQVTAVGQVAVTGMLSHQLYLLTPTTGRMEEVPLPLERSNPRALEIAPNGDWWVVLGAPHRIARYVPSTRSWTTYDATVYAHSVALASDGKAWFNGHFTKAPEQVGFVEPTTGRVELRSLPPHPELATDDGGPIPYEIRVAPDGRVWMSELQGNRLTVLDPVSGRTSAIDMPVPSSGPRRFDIAADGVLWIPEYAGNALTRYDPSSGRFTQYTLPVRDAVPYVARVHPRTGHVWVGASASDEVLEFEPTTGRWTSYALPARGALVRHLAFDPRSNDVWVAYGAAPGIAARIARLTP